MENLKFIDLFAGIGGIRKGLELAAADLGIPTKCVFTSEIKPHAIKVLQQNHPEEKIFGDITKIDANEIPDFDILCAGFPCQAFSAAGNRRGFADTRGTMFFEVERILKEKKPKGFILENVEGLVNHDKGRTLNTILSHLNDLGYKVSYAVLNSKDFGVPQDRKRIYILGSFIKEISLSDFPVSTQSLSEILEQDKPCSITPFTQTLLSHYKPEELIGKSIKDKRGGKENIHSWDIGIKGEVSDKEKDLLNKILTERRKKKWAQQYGIDWMDGMPLTKEMISSFYNDNKLDDMLKNLVNKGYLVMEYPKRKIPNLFGESVSGREQDPTLPIGYNIVAGKLSYEVGKILDPKGIAPTLVAMDMQKLYVVDNGGLRKLTLHEGLRIFGYPEDFKLNLPVKDGYDLLGNTVVVPVIKAVTKRLLTSLYLTL